MAYKKIKSYKMTEAELRQIWKEEYCEQEIITFDAVTVKFYEDMFDHAFYESADNIEKDKSILSYNRLEKIYWIKEVLQDPEAVLKKGWDNYTKTVCDDRRVAMVKGNYIVVIRFTGLLKAKLVTAFEMQDGEDIQKVLDGPDFEKTEAFFGKA